MASFKETPPIPRQIHPHLLDLLTDSRNRRNGGRVFKSHSTGRTRGNTLLTDKIKAIKIRAGRETLYSTPASSPASPLLIGEVAAISAGTGSGEAVSKIQRLYGIRPYEELVDLIKRDSRPNE